jgi:hypothetical protein
MSMIIPFSWGVNSIKPRVSESGLFEGVLEGVSVPPFPVGVSEGVPEGVTGGFLSVPL